jgi:hypothetical protein
MSPSLRLAKTDTKINRLAGLFRSAFSRKKLFLQKKNTNFLQKKLQICFLILFSRKKNLKLKKNYSIKKKILLKKNQFFVLIFSKKNHFFFNFYIFFKQKSRRECSPSLRLAKTVTLQSDRIPKWFRQGWKGWMRLNHCLRQKHF